MKTIGILTFHRAYNFGAVLQAYALQKTISNMGKNCEVIDYRNPRIENSFHSASMKSKLLSVIKYVVYHNYFVEGKRKAKLFADFTEKYLELSECYKGSEQFKDCYEKIIVGSDQVWNIEMTQGDKNFFLPYKEGALKLSYAASFGKKSFSKENEYIMSELLKDFENLYVRESAGKDIVNRLLKKEATTVVDPTLLIDSSCWRKIAFQPTKITKKYILLYLVADETYSIELAKNIAKAKNLEVIYVDPPRFQFEGITRLKEVGPAEFLWLVMKAEYVITTSYHGLIFSLNLNTPFLFEKANNIGNTNSRLDEIVQLFGLEKYAIKSSNALDYNGLEYDWKRINSRIEEERKKSLALLEKIV